MVELNLLAILQTIAAAGTVGLLAWVARTMFRVSERLAVHEEKHHRHDARFERLEEKVF